MISACHFPKVCKTLSFCFTSKKYPDETMFQRINSLLLRIIHVKVTVSKSGHHHRMLIFPHTIHSLYEPEKKKSNFKNPVFNIQIFHKVLQIVFSTFFIVKNFLQILFSMFYIFTNFYHSTFQHSIF